jgi:long-chain acyl-CoA synthetase
MTYAELDALSDSCAEGLAAIGIEAGDAVALQLPNVPQFLVAVLRHSQRQAPSSYR